jgi:DNA mismatch endonuclease (patch repair protein)
MTDKVTPQQRSYIMSRVHSSRNASTEMRLISLMRHHGVKGWRRNVPLLGRPDFVFREPRVAVFVDGCFWHGCPECYRAPKSNDAYWNSKIKRNVQRDKEVSERLAQKGWIVFRIWEHELKGKSASTPKWLERLAAILECK